MSRHPQATSWFQILQIRLSNTTLCVTSAKDAKTKGAHLILTVCLRVPNQVIAMSI